jgi:hypothetical protein
MPRNSWLRTAIVFGVSYAAVGILLALPTSNVRAWRLAAWALSALLYVLHLTYEQFKLRYAPRLMALHVASAVGMGALLLAVSATIHSLFAPPDYSRWKFALALVLWPIITALPAFLFAFMLGLVLKQTASD